MSDFRALDQTGDWSFGNGREDYATAQAAVVLDIATALRTFLGECFFATNFGVDWWNLLGTNDEAAIILQCRQLIASRENVTKINFVTAAINSRSRLLQITFNINTVFSRQNTTTVTVQ